MTNVLEHTFLERTPQIAMRASIRLHNRMYDSVMRAALAFFRTHPTGQILNRFSKDMGQVDDMLPTEMMDVIQIYLLMCGVIVIVSVANVWMLVPTLVIGLVLYGMRGCYLRSSLNMKRIEAICELRLGNLIIRILKCAFRQLARPFTRIWAKRLTACRPFALPAPKPISSQRSKRCWITTVRRTTCSSSCHGRLASGWT